MSGFPNLATARGSARHAVQRCVFIALAAGALIAPIVFSAQPETVIVPYDPGKPVAGQQPDQFYLPYERFLELWEKAKTHR
ncbi:MAG: hypothetical protein M3463_22325, partial [Verrucomicrobiota bacterium]|nr:hypothetical protein [Verrucomicrobiota bacterium]